MKLILNINYLLLNLLFITLLASFSFAQSASEINQGREFEQQAVENYKAKNFAGFLENIKKANQLRPNHPRLLYNLADAYALNGKNNESLEILDQISKMGLYYSPGKDADFKSLFQLKQFQIIQQKINFNHQPINLSSKAFSLPDKNLVIEGIAYDPQNERFFVSSINQRKIFVIDKNGVVNDFSKETDGLWSVLGMKVDSQKQILWVTTSALPQMRGFEKSDEGKSGIFKYDLQTGNLIKKYVLSNQNESHGLGDLIINRKGDVFATDSVSPIIYHIDSNKDTLEVFLNSDMFASLQGLTFTPDEKFLFIADYSKGIFRLEIKTGDIIQLKPEKDITLLGIDGLYYHQGKLIGVQNGISPQRIVQLSLNSGLTEITKYKTLEANFTNYFDPTLGAIKDNDFYYIGNSQWSLINEKGELNAQNLKLPEILRLHL